MENNKDKKHIFSTDRPIQRASNDKLNRVKFSTELANSISRWTEKDSLVVAIYGNWGDGKTSVKNMVKEVFEENKKPTFMEFNPWQWADENHITEAFFKEISNKLNNSSDDSQRKAAAKLLDYAEYLELGNELVDKYKKIVERVLIFAVGGAGMLSLSANEEKRWWLALSAFILSICTIALEQIIWGLKWLARWKKIGVKGQKNLEERKSELVVALGEMKTTLVVFIDDIDRLSKNETKTIFRLIKANADFPNIVYLTLFQRDIVEKNLAQDEEYKGSEYLKKIVQVGFSLPKIPIDNIHKILFKELDRLLDESGLEKKFEQDRWSELFNDGLSNYFKNLRDVNRFISTFSFHLGTLKSDTTYEVNFIDLVGFEVLRQFEPAVYESMYYAKKLLTGSASNSRYSRQDAEKKQMEDILNSASPENKESVKSIIKVLFPNSQWAWGSNYHSSVGDEEFINLRVNHEDRFDRYFSLYLPDEEIKQSEFEYALTIVGDEDKFLSFLMNYYQQGRLNLFIKRFEAFKQQVDKKDAIPFISVMLKIGDILSDKFEGFFFDSPVMHVKRIIYWYFRKHDFNEEEKREAYWQSLSKSTGIYLPIFLLWEELDKREVDRYPDQYLLTKVDPEKIKQLLIEKLKTNKNSSEFKSSIHLPRMISIWLKVDEASAKAWFNAYILDDSALLKFLIDLESTGTSSTGKSSETYYYIQLSWLKVFFEDPVALAKRVRELKSKVQINSDELRRVFENIDRAEDQHLHPEKHPDIFRGR